MSYLSVIPAFGKAVATTVRRAIKTHRDIVALAERRPTPARNELISETKTVDVWDLDGQPVVVHTWLLTYQDGHHDTLQRRFPVTDPAERRALECA